MKLKIGDYVECKNRSEMGFGRVCFVWLTGDIDVNYPDGKKLMNCPQEDFEVLPQTIVPTELPSETGSEKAVLKEEKA